MAPNQPNNHHNTPASGNTKCYNIRPEIAVLDHTYTWVIDDFLGKMEAKETLRGSLYGFKKSDGLELTWRPELEFAEDQSIGIYCTLGPTTSNKKQLAWLRFNLIGADNRIELTGGIFLCVFDPTSTKDNIWGYSHLVKCTEITKSHKRFLNCGKLTVQVKLTVVDDEIDRDSHMVDPLVHEKRHHAFCQPFLDMLDDESMCDLTIMCGHVPIRAHRMMLAARSPVFAAMLTHDQFTENQEGKVNVSDIEPDVMRQLLRYIYSGRVDLVLHEKAFMAEYGMDMLAAADKYGLIQLKNELAGELSKGNLLKFSKENFCQIFQLAIVYDAEQMVTAGMKFLEHHAKRTLVFVDYERMIKSPVDFLRTHCDDLLQLPGFNKILRDRPELTKKVAKFLVERDRKFYSGGSNKKTTPRRSKNSLPTFLVTPPQ